MNESKPGKEEFDLPDFWRSLQDLEDGSIDPVRRDELMVLLQRSARARLAYFEYFQQSAVCEMEGAKMNQAGRLPVISESGPSPRLFRRALMVAAAVTVLLAIVATLIVIERPEPEVFKAAVAAETRWFIDEVRQESGNTEDEVTEGSTVRVLSGTVELTLPSGTAMVMQGPARVFFPKLTEPVLKEGWLWVDSGENGEDLSVEAKGLTIRDVGTRFGVRAPLNGLVEVHLIEGRVQVQDGKSGKKLADLDSVEEAFAIRSDGALQERELAPDPFPDLAGLLAAEPGVHTTILSQSPTGYWKLEERQPGGLVNEISGGIPGGHGLAVRPGEAGVGRQERFGGFSPRNRALYLSGDPHRSVILGLSGPKGVSVREGAVSFWMRSPSGRDQEEALWLAGRSERGSREPTETYLYTGLTPSGQVCFCVGDRQFGLVQVSPDTVRDGKWHHVVASWGPATIDLFVDGRLVGREGAPEQSEDDRLTGRYVRFGKPGLDWRHGGTTSFEGWVDEIAMWNRPLTHEEVLHQFESAKGSARESNDQERDRAE